MFIQIPKPKITKEQWDKFLKDPEVVTLEILFIFITLTNIFVLYRILLDVCPFPVTVTWFQLLMGLIFASVLGASSQEFPRCAFFPRFSIDWKLYQSLAMPILVFLGMITMANVLLHQIPSIASFPVAVSLAVILHHVSRFLGCGQIYLPIRWIALGIMLLGFLIGVIDPGTVGILVFPAVLAYGVFSSIFRAWCLEKALHIVEGKGDVLHNHQVVLGVLLLPFIAAFLGEGKVFQWMPLNFGKLFTWQYWGTLVCAGTIPFVKNVIANRLIRRTGQAPWRFLELVSMFLVFLIGFGVWNMISIAGCLAFLLVLVGRTIGMLDAISKDPNERRRAIRGEAQHGASPPSFRYDPTGLADSFEQLQTDESVELTYYLTSEEVVERGIEMHDEGQGEWTKATGTNKYVVAKPWLMTPVAEDLENGLVLD